MFPSTSTQQKIALDHNLPDVLAIFEVLFPAHLHMLQSGRKRKVTCFFAW